MHFFYLDEAGCTGEDLQNQEQPVFVAGGLIVRDEGWNKTKEVFAGIVRDYFDANVPAGFELHSHDLLSPNGQGFFEGHPRPRRLILIDKVLGLLESRSHHTFYFAINKAKLAGILGDELKTKAYLPRRAPYTIAYDYLISVAEWYTREKLGRSARGMVIVDTKDDYSGDISSVTQYRRVDAPAAQRVKWLTEFTYAVDSHKNPMVQISDLICFITKKYLEIEAGYRDNWPVEAKTFYRDLYAKVHDRLIKKEALGETGRNSDQYNKFVSDIAVIPARNFKQKRFA
jgi:hypothetical protein